MNDATPTGYISIQGALNRLGRELFPSDWTGEEPMARRGLLSEDEWLKIKDVPPARGSGAPGDGTMLRETMASPPTAARAQVPSDPSDPLYQAEYKASERYAAAGKRLRQMLEAGDLEATILDPWNGGLHRASPALWRRHDARRLIDSGRAPLPSSPNMGSLFVKDFAAASAPTKPFPAAKIEEVIRVLREKTTAQRLTGRNRRISYARISRLTVSLSVNSVRYFGRFRCLRAGLETPGNRRAKEHANGNYR
jgi:hypothetical protein